MLTDFWKCVLVFLASDISGTLLKKVWFENGARLISVFSLAKRLSELAANSFGFATQALLDARRSDAETKYSRILDQTSVLVCSSSV